MEGQRPYEEILTRAETLPPQELTRLSGELSRFLHEKYGKWTDLKGVEEVRDYHHIQDRVAYARLLAQALSLEGGLSSLTSRNDRLLLQMRKTQMRQAQE